MKKTTFFSLGFVALVVSLILSSIFVAADTYHLFEKKNELLMVENHKIVLVDVTNDNECIFTIDGEGKVILQNHKDGIKDVNIFVKKAFDIRTKTGNSVYCDAFIDVKASKETEKNKELKIIVSPNASTNNNKPQAQTTLDDTTASQSDLNTKKDVTTPPVEEVKANKGFVQRLVEFLKNWFK